MWIHFYDLLAINVIYFYKKRKVIDFLRFKKLTKKYNNDSSVIAHYNYSWCPVIMEGKGQLTSIMKRDILGFGKYIFCILSIFNLTYEDFLTFNIVMLENSEELVEKSKELVVKLGGDMCYKLELSLYQKINLLMPDTTTRLINHKRQLRDFMNFKGEHWKLVQ